VIGVEATTFFDCFPGNAVRFFSNGPLADQVCQFIHTFSKRAASPDKTVALKLARVCFSGVPPLPT
jgi:hypothetical protein